MAAHSVAVPVPAPAPAPVPVPVRMSEPEPSCAFLLREGHDVFPLPLLFMEQARAELGEYLQHIPELKAPAPPDADVGPGSFGAINFASAFHAPVAETVDRAYLQTAMPLLAALAAELGHSSYQPLPDRLAKRTNRQPPESYHRDQSGGVTDERDVLLGGFVNLNRDATQSFVCVPGTHRLRSTRDGRAFSKLTEEEVKVCKRKEVTVAVPPGHAIVFFENIVHRVSGAKPTEPLLRKFVAVRLTSSNEPLYPENVERAQRQAPLVIKGGFVAPCYPTLYRVNFFGKLLDFASRLVPRMLEEVTRQDCKAHNGTYLIPRREPPSLTELSARYEHASSGYRFDVRRFPRKRTADEAELAERE